jgi:hypothetical protein
MQLVGLGGYARASVSLIERAVPLPLSMAWHYKWQHHHDSTTTVHVLCDHLGGGGGARRADGVDGTLPLTDGAPPRGGGGAARRAPAELPTELRASPAPLPAAAAPSTRPCGAVGSFLGLSTWLRGTGARSAGMKGLSIRFECRRRCSPDSRSVMTASASTSASSSTCVRWCVC